jgi:hypothetical protein
VHIGALHPCNTLSLKSPERVAYRLCSFSLSPFHGGVGGWEIKNMSARGADASARLCGGEAALDSCAFAGDAGMAHFAGSLSRLPPLRDLTVDHVA